MSAIVNDFENLFTDSNQFDPFGNVIFLLAGHFAGLAPPAGYSIYDQGISFHYRSPSRFLKINLAQQRSDVCGPHSGVAAFIGVIGQNVDIGFVPAM